MSTNQCLSRSVAGVSWKSEEPECPPRTSQVSGRTRHAAALADRGHDAKGEIYQRVQRLSLVARRGVAATSSLVDARYFNNYLRKWRCRCISRIPSDAVAFVLPCPPAVVQSTLSLVLRRFCNWMLGRDPSVKV